MFVITPPIPSAEATSMPAPRQLPISIEASSPFTPKLWICPSCNQKNHVETSQCKCCSHELTSTITCYPLLDQRNRPVSPLARFPVYWLCSTCHVAHYLLEILVKKASCTCGRPTLQAVYDQFGDLFLFWPDDEQIRDLTEKPKVEEAARRLWAAGGGRWVDEMPVIRMREEDDANADGAGMLL
jgi:hypothetical protein